MPAHLPLLLILLVLTGCDRGMEVVVPAAPPATVTTGRSLLLPEDAAGRLMARAIAAAGGWDAWMRHRDVSFISTFTLLDQRGTPTSETIFLHKLLLHGPPRSRLESIGLDDELLFGLNGRDWWMMRAGHLLTDERSTAFTHFEARNAEYWFRLPFVFAEVPGAMSYLGEDADGSRRWEKLRIDYTAEAPVPVNWVVVYVNVDTGLIDRVFCEMRTDLLRQTLWRGELDDYRTIDGIRRERRRDFFPVNDIDKLLGTKAAQQIIEHVRFDNNFSTEMFERPPITDGSRTAT